MKHLSRRIGKLEARIGPQERPADESVRELIQRRCQRLGNPYGGTVSGILAGHGDNEPY